MSREIKFKVWCNENEQFIQFNKMGFLEDGSLWYVQGIDENEEETDPPYFENQNDWELMQYTGLKDKNGVEIYEGDILFHPLQGRRKVFYPYSETVASYGLRDIDNGFGSTLQDSHAIWEVIGNIYENKELLEREAE